MEHLSKVESYCDGRLLAAYGVPHSGLGISQEGELLLHGRGLYSKGGEICDAIQTADSVYTIRQVLIRGRY